MEEIVEYLKRKLAELGLKLKTKQKAKPQHFVPTLIELV